MKIEHVAMWVKDLEKAKNFGSINILMGSPS